MWNIGRLFGRSSHCARTHALFRFNTNILNYNIILWKNVNNSALLKPFAVLSYYMQPYRVRVYKKSNLIIALQFIHCNTYINCNSYNQCYFNSKLKMRIKVAKYIFHDFFFDNHVLCAILKISCVIKPRAWPLCRDIAFVSIAHDFNFTLILTSLL